MYWSCDDSNECTTSDVCSGGSCVGGAVADGTSCTDNLLFCDGTESCQSGSCVNSGTPCIDDGFICTTESCDEVSDSC